MGASDSKGTAVEAGAGKSFLHGGDIRGAADALGVKRENILDFSANINPLGMLPEVERAVTDALDDALDYPDPFCRELTRRIAQVTGRKPSQILCGNGGADLIYRLAYALKPKAALITAPTFAEYEEALLQTGTRVDLHELGEDFTVGMDYVERLNPSHGLVFICNPNNPTGLITPKAVVRALLDKAALAGTRVCVDECFLDFVAERDEYSVSDLVDDYPNLIILKSFTKLYAMPGLRLGYVVSSDEELLGKMSRAGQPWGVSTLAQAAGIAALSDTTLRGRTVAFVDEERAFLKRSLEGLGLHVLDGRANYLCFRAAGDCGLVERALKEGILLRSCANYHGMGADYYRAAVRARDENERLLAVLRKVL